MDLKNDKDNDDDLEYLYKASQVALTNGGLLQTLA